MVATGLLVAAYVLQADINRHRAQFMKRGYLPSADGKSHGDEAFFIIGIVGITGLVSSRLYSVLESPRELIANPAVLISRYGFTWSGAFITVLIALVFLARHFRIPVLEFMDLCMPPGALGYAIGRIGCLLSGDGDYGVPTNLPWGMSFPNGLVPTTETCVQRGWPASCRVHPTPIYEFLAGVIIAAFLWRMGKKGTAGARSSGEIFGAYLILTGIARFLVEFIRLNPIVFYGLTNAQVVSLLSMLAGAVLLWRIKRKPSLRSESA
jgi:phosphatidylglycerol:prolipoprotein diacylglycerol transferase